MKNEKEGRKRIKNTRERKRKEIKWGKEVGGRERMKEERGRKKV